MDTLAAALFRLSIDVEASVILEAVREEELKKAPVRRSRQSRTALLKLASEAPDPSAKSTFSYTPTPIFFEHLPRPNSDPLSNVRRERLREMAAEAFPPGQPLPDPYMTTWLTMNAQDSAMNRLPS